MRPAGALLYSWSRKAVAGKPATPRELQALVSYMPLASQAVWASMGGEETLAWAHKALDGYVEEPMTADPGRGEILVLGLPYGGPNGGRDSSGQFFSPMTDFMDGLIDSPPVMYTHGTQYGFDPEPVGQVKGRWYDRKGGWFKVQLDPQSPRYHQLLEANATDNLRASTGAVPAASKLGETGHIDNWLVGELSLVDLREGYRPVNSYAITKAEPAVSEDLFRDYYGEPVELREPTLFETLRDLIDQLRLELANRIAASGHDIVDDYMVDSADETFYWKASAEFGGKKRSELKPSDFLFPETESFPVKDCEDVTAAVRSWGRYKGSESFETFKRKLIARARGLGCTDQIPESWSTTKAEESMENDTEKCEACEEAAREAETLKAELAAAPARCSRCPEAIRTIRDFVKAGRMAPAEAFAAMERFTKSDDGLDLWRAEIEARDLAAGVRAAMAVVTAPASAPAPIKAEGVQLYVAGGAASGDPDDMFGPVDQAHMEKQRRLVGLKAR